MSLSKAKALDPGALSVRMQVYEPASTEDGLGGSTVSWTFRRSVWAAFEADSPSRRSTDPVANSLGRGKVFMRIGLCPPVGWRLRWSDQFGEHTVEVSAVERGTQRYPFDSCSIEEIAP